MKELKMVVPKERKTIFQTMHLYQKIFVKVPSDIDLKIVPVTRFGTITLTSLRISSFD